MKAFSYSKFVDTGFRARGRKTSRIAADILTDAAEAATYES